MKYKKIIKITREKDSFLCKNFLSLKRVSDKKDSIRSIEYINLIIINLQLLIITKIHYYQ